MTTRVSLIRIPLVVDLSQHNKLAGNKLDIDATEYMGLDKQKKMSVKL